MRETFGSRKSVSKNSPRSWTGMPLARKSKIFGLHSIPVGTTPVSLKNRLFSGFSLTRCFSAAPVSGKTKKAALPPQKQNLGFIDRLRRCRITAPPNLLKPIFPSTLDVCAKKSLIEKRFNCFFRIPCEVPQAKGFRCI